MVRLVLHVGMAKTGTSTLQATLRRHEKLLARAGVLYPRPSRRHRSTFQHTNHNLLTCLLKPPESVPREFASGTRDPAALRRVGAAFWDDIERQVRASDAETVVLSGEYLFSLSVGHLEHLRDLLRSLFDEIEVVAYVREPASYHLASTQQKVKAAYRVKAPADSTYPATTYLRRYLDVFEGSVAVRTFSRGGLLGSCIVEDFLTTYVPGGGELSRRVAVVDVNTSMSAEAMCIMQQLRRYGWPDDDDRFAVESTRVAVLLEEMRSRTPQSPARLKPAIEERIRGRFRTDVEWLADRFGVAFEESARSAQPLAEGDPPAGWTSTDLVDVLEVDQRDIDETLHLLLKELAGRQRPRWLRRPASLRGVLR